MVSFLSKFLDSNEKQISRLQRDLRSINDFDDSNLDTQKIQKKIQSVKKNVKKELEGIIIKDEYSKDDIQKIRETLKKYLPEVFALVRRSADIVAGIRHYDVQLMAGMALFEGRLIELGTGEGKTLVATLPLSLYSLLGLGCQIITVNDYLARRDGEWCGHIYDTLGLTTGIITSNGSYVFKKDVEEIKGPKPYEGEPKLNQMHGYNLVEASKKEAYACDVTYCTNNELGFDYLRDNMNISVDQMVLKKLFYCIVDEADSILIDESRTPLIISAPAEQSNDLYVTFAKVVTNLKKDDDYTVDEKQRRVILNDQGIDKVEKMLSISNVWEDFMLAHHLENALAAKELYQNGDEYLVKDGQVLIVDEFTGRIMEGRRFSEGIHQAIEAKEGVSIKEESRTVATITFQNLFRLFSILSGMTGTALTEAEEFAKIYGIDVIAIPTNKPVIRKDLNDVIYKSEDAKFKAVVEDIKAKHEKGQPVLVGTISVDKSEKLSEYLKKAGLPHEVLNAKYHEKEAEIISLAGQPGQITISTNMAGRGTDITLGDGVKEVGGLAVIGTERHESRRIDNQLRGRSGRQGDPGETRFYISLEDNLMRIFGGERIASIMTGMKFDENIPLEFGIFSKQIESAQKRVESMYFDARKHLVEYDDVLNIQREIVYKRRRFILSLFDGLKEGKKVEEERMEYIMEKVNNSISSIIDMHSVDGELEEVDFNKVREELSLIIPNHLLSEALKKAGTNESEWLELIKGGKARVISEKLKEQYAFVADEVYAYIQEIFTPQFFAEKNKRDLLRIIDILWVEHLDAIEGLKEGIGLSAYSQKDPLIEYKNQAYIQFESLINTIDTQLAMTVFRIEEPEKVREILFSQLQTNEEQIESNLEEKFNSEEAQPIGKKVSVKTKEKSDKPKGKIGRNDLCPCGSGKKYKKCGALNTKEHQDRMALKS